MCIRDRNWADQCFIQKLLDAPGNCSALEQEQLVAQPFVLYFSCEMFDFKSGSTEIHYINMCQIIVTGQQRKRF